MPLSVYDAGWAHPAKTVQVADTATTWKRAKKIKSWNGTAWVLAWVHPVMTASLSLSKSGVAVGEEYNLVLDVPSPGFPEGAGVTFRRTGYTQTLNPSEGSIRISLGPVSHAASGTFTWYVDITTKGGDTTFGPITQSVATTSTTVTLTAPAWALSASNSGAGGTATIAQAPFSIVLSAPAIVTTLSFQLSLAGGAWTEYKSWTNPTATTNHLQTFNTTGSWRARAVATQNNAIVIYSAEKTLTCYAKSLVASASPTDPVVGDTVTLTASHTGDALAQATNAWSYMRPSDGIWHDNWQTGNPSIWKPAGVDDVYFRWVETYSDGSTIRSNNVRSIVTNHYHKVLANGASAATIQAEMNAAKTWFLANRGGAVDWNDENTFACVELATNGVYNLGSAELFARRGVRLVSGGSGASRAYVAAKGTHFMKCDNNGGGNYSNPDYDWMVHNIEIDCFDISGGFSIVHTGRFQISNCYFHNMGAVKHYIEINSSGKLRADGTYNVRILSNEFVNSSNIAGRRVLDECVQLDYSWDGAASNTANDGTVANNILIQSNNFHDAPRGVGGHRFQTAGGAPDAFHSNIVVQSNTFTNIDPSQYSGDPNGVGSEGAVRSYGWQYAHILNNVFDNCFQPICLYIPADCPAGLGDPDYFRIADNYLRDVVQDRHGIYGTSAHATTKFRRVLIEGNIADQTWDTSPDIYFAGIDDTRGNFSGYTQGAIIRNNVFKPTNYDAAGEKAYNKYRGQNSSNETGVLCTGNTVSDGAVDNS